MQGSPSSCRVTTGHKETIRGGWVDHPVLHPLQPSPGRQEPENNPVNHDTAKRVTSDSRALLSYSRARRWSQQAVPRPPAHWAPGPPLGPSVNDQGHTWWRLLGPSPGGRRAKPHSDCQHARSWSSASPTRGAESGQAVSEGVLGSTRRTVGAGQEVPAPPSKRLEPALPGKGRTQLGPCSPPPAQVTRPPHPHRAEPDTRREAGLCPSSSTPGPLGSLRWVSLVRTHAQSWLVRGPRAHQSDIPTELTVSAGLNTGSAGLPAKFLCHRSETVPPSPASGHRDSRGSLPPGASPAVGSSADTVGEAWLAGRPRTVQGAQTTLSLMGFGHHTRSTQPTLQAEAVITLRRCGQDSPRLCTEAQRPQPPTRGTRAWRVPRQGAPEAAQNMGHPPPCGMITHGDEPSGGEAGAEAHGRKKQRARKRTRGDTAHRQAPVRVGQSLLPALTCRGGPAPPFPELPLGQEGGPLPLGGGGGHGGSALPPSPAQGRVVPAPVPPSFLPAVPRGKPSLWPHAVWPCLPASFSCVKCGYHTCLRSHRLTRVLFTDPHAGPCWGVGTVPTVSSPSYSRRARSLAGSGRGGRGSRGDSLQPGRRQDCPRRTPWGDHADTGQKTTLGHPEGDCDPRVAMCGWTAEWTPATSQEASTKGSLVRTAWGQRPWSRTTRPGGHGERAERRASHQMTAQGPWEHPGPPPAPVAAPPPQGQHPAQGPTLPNQPGALAAGLSFEEWGTRLLVFCSRCSSCKPPRSPVSRSGQTSEPQCNPRLEGLRTSGSGPALTQDVTSAESPLPDKGAFRGSSGRAHPCVGQSGLFKSQETTSLSCFRVLADAAPPHPHRLPLQMGGGGERLRPSLLGVRVLCPSVSFHSDTNDVLPHQTAIGIH
ncbi:hypothetical protein Cadr_000017705 [Camelus dromedarius]|uniref:Uncharacterized protein n=1 Tax=Camelus dromedarius TaxID=9838 RepID=A0A5N4D7K8_CAMDR|nr:hypothetical protein Cadr_000017705 [Camelus dromedarius]